MPENKKRYDFGRNWGEYSSSISCEEINSAVDGVSALLPYITSKHVVDIGCGSGIHALAFLKLEASSVTCIDYDEDSVNTTRNVLLSYGADYTNYRVIHGDILSKSGDVFKEG